MPEFDAPKLLTDGDNVSRFECGEPALNEFLRRHASDAAAIQNHIMLG